MCIYPTYKATGIRMAKGACMCGRVAFEFSGEPVKTVSAKNAECMSMLTLIARCSVRISGVQALRTCCHYVSWGRLYPIPELFEHNTDLVLPIKGHCLNCKRITGTAYSTNVTVLTSTLRTYGSPKQFTFDSGQGPIFRIFFCDNCSSTLWKESDADGFKGLTLIQSGTLGMEFDNYPPNGEIFTPFRSKWLAPLLVQQFEGTDSGL